MQTYFSSENSLQKPQSSVPAAQSIQSQPTNSAPTAKPISTANKGGIRGLSDFSKQDADDGSDSEEEKVNWFTGGEKSGMVVQAPKKKDRNEALDDLINVAKQSGAKTMEEYHADQNKPFSGQGARLGSTNAPSMSPSTRKQEDRKKIILWKNGFQFDDGPIRDYNDPKNAAFLDSIKKGTIPQEIRSLGNDILIELQDSRSEDYKEPPKVIAPFSGSGHTLGSSSQPTSQTTWSAPSSTTINPVQVDESQPTTSVQIRCSDGSRLVGKFNHTHSIKDIRRFIDSSKGTQGNYDLFFSFPQKLIADESQTISAAGLANSVVIQKSK